MHNLTRGKKKLTVAIGDYFVVEFINVSNLILVVLLKILIAYLL